MSGERILFVDDEAQIRKLLSTYLTRQGYDVVTATDGYEALKSVRASAPALVILRFDPDSRSATAIRRADPSWASRLSVRSLRDDITHQPISQSRPKEPISPQ